MIIDAHAHLGNRNNTNIDFYLKEMEKYGINKTIFCPGDMVDVVKMADFMRGNEPLMNFEPHNEWIKAAIEAYPDKVYGFFMVDPEIHNIDDVKTAIIDGFVGIKLNPLINKIDFYSEFLGDIFELSSKWNIPIYTHLTMNPKANIESLAWAIDKYSPIVIIGHMGFSSADWEAVQLCKEYENVYLETSVGSFLAIKNAIPYIGAGKIIFGTEGPSHNAKVELTKIEMLELPEADKELILHKNIERIIENETPGKDY